MTGIHDQQPVEAFGTRGPDKTFGDPIRFGNLNRRTNDSSAFRLKHRIEAVRELPVVIANDKTNGLRALAERPCDLPRLLRDPHCVWMRRAAGQMYAATADLDEEQRVQSLEPDRVHGEEIDRDDALRLGPQKLTP